MGDLQNELKKKVLKNKEANNKEDPAVISFYKDGILDKDLVSKQAEKWVDEFYPNPGNKNDKRNLTSAQIRKFYGEVLAIEEKLNVQKNFAIVHPQILMLKSKAAYAANPNNRKIPDSFKNWIFRMVDSIKDERDFKAFKTIFEAIVGYFYGKGA